MFVYSKQIMQFINEIKWVLKDVLAREMYLKVHGDRFYDLRQQASYPIKVVIYNNKSMLGYFDPNFYELGFHECLMHSRLSLHSIIKHELAHYITFINYGNSVQPHGVEFNAFCQKMGWGEEVFKATSCLDDGQSVFKIEENGIFRKVQKLMALANSANKHEAEQAMIKSQQLLLKHHIDTKYVEANNDEKIYLKRIMKQKKENAKMRSIAKILETFFVNVVYNKGKGCIHLEIVGNAVNIEIAEHVASVLEIMFDELWIQAKQQANLKGMIAKNSFFFGLARGYCNKIQALKREYNTEIMNALIVLEKQLVDARSLIYPQLSMSKSSASLCRESSALGEQMGRNLNINPALTKSTSKSEALLTFSD